MLIPNPDDVCVGAILRMGSFKKAEDLQDKVGVGGRPPRLCRIAGPQVNWNSQGVLSSQNQKTLLRRPKGWAPEFLFFLCSEDSLVQDRRLAFEGISFQAVWVGFKGGTYAFPFMLLFWVLFIYYVSLYYIHSF